MSQGPGGGTGREVGGAGRGGRWGGVGWGGVGWGGVGGRLYSRNPGRVDSWVVSLGLPCVC